MTFGGDGQGPGGPAETGSAGEVTASKFFLWTGRSLWGMIVRDDLMALDYLCSRPEVDASRVGVTGISMGATRTWWIMALDERPKTGVAVGCLTRYQNLIQNEGLKYHGIYYFVPQMLRHFDTEAVVALAAPRPIYALYGKETAFENLLYPGVGHVYLPEMWQKTLAWMDKLGLGVAPPLRGLRFRLSDDERGRSPGRDRLPAFARPHHAPGGSEIGTPPLQLHGLSQVPGPRGLSGQQAAVGYTHLPGPETNSASRASMVMPTWRLRCRRRGEHVWVWLSHVFPGCLGRPAADGR